MAGPLPPLNQEAAFQKLQEYYDSKGKDLNIKDLFVKDSKRFSKYRWVFVSISPQRVEVTYLVPAYIHSFVYPPSAIVYSSSCALPTFTFTIGCRVSPPLDLSLRKVTATTSESYLL